MCVNSRLRYVLCTFFVLQLILTIEILVFNILGYLWIPIIVHTVHLVFLFIGLFGAIQKRYKCCLSCILWLVIFIGWNLFLICLYLSVGYLNQNQHFLSLYVVQSNSWWKGNGIGCSPGRGISVTISASEDCGILSFIYVELIHSGSELLLSVILLCCSIPYYIYVRRDRLKNKEFLHDGFDIVRMNSLNSSASHYHQANRLSSLDAIIEGEMRPSRSSAPGMSSSSLNMDDDAPTRMTSLGSLTNVLPSSDKKAASSSDTKSSEPPKSRPDKHPDSTRKVKSASKERKSHRSSKRSKQSPPSDAKLDDDNHDEDEKRPQLPSSVTVATSLSRPGLLQRMDSEAMSDALPPYDHTTYLGHEDVFRQNENILHRDNATSQSLMNASLIYNPTGSRPSRPFDYPSRTVPSTSSDDPSISHQTPHPQSNQIKAIRHPYPSSVPVPQLKVISSPSRTNPRPNFHVDMNDLHDEEEHSLSRKPFKPPVLASINRNQNLMENFRSSNRSLGSSSDNSNMHSINRSKSLQSDYSIESVERTVEQSGEVYL